MRILLDNVIERNAISCVCGADVEQGMILKIDGLASPTYGAGECYSVSKSADNTKDLFVVVAHDGHSYTSDEYAFADKATIKAGEPFRAYVLEGYQVITVERAVCSAELSVGSYVGADTTGKWVATSSNDDATGKVLAVTKLADKTAYQILIVR